MTIHSTAATPNTQLNAWPLPKGLPERLQREHGWSLDFIGAAEREYRRFVYLATTHGPATPSQTVDEVWHAHLMFTRDYWGGFQDVLPHPLHHDPGTGEPGDPEHFRAQYLRTLAQYSEVFGEEAPERFWPRPAAPAEAPVPPALRKAQQGSARLPVIFGIALIVLTLAVLARPLGPLEILIGGLATVFMVALALGQGAAHSTDPATAQYAAARKDTSGGSCGGGVIESGALSSDGGGGDSGGGDGGGSSCGGGCGGGCGS